MKLQDVNPPGSLRQGKAKHQLTNLPSNTEEEKRDAETVEKPKKKKSSKKEA